MKSIRLFLKDHFSFLAFQVFLMAFILCIFWLDGFRKTDTIVYSIVIMILLTGGFLLGKFIMRRSFYAAIVQTPHRMEDALIRHTQSPEHKEVAAYTRELYRLYQKEVQALYTSQNRQIDYMNHWAHQMKTPISVIGLLLQDEEHLDRDSILEEVERIRSGLDSVLVTARLETFEKDMQIERIGLRKLVQEVVTENKRLFITKGIFPEVSIDEQFIVATDIKWIKIAMVQFITNAVKYSFDEGKKVYFSAEHTEEGIHFSVRDEGIGIPASDMKRLMNPFFTGENGRLTGESTGMGLYIASFVCEKLGHPLSIQSEVGEGTVVSVLFENGESEEKLDGKTNSNLNGNHENL